MIGETEDWARREGEGIAIMTSSVMGTELCIRLLHAIAYLRNWPGREVVQVTPTGGLACPLSDAKVAVDQAVEGVVRKVEGDRQRRRWEYEKQSSVGDL